MNSRIVEVGPASRVGVLLLLALSVAGAALPATAATATPPTRVPGVLTVGLRPSAVRFQRGVVQGGLVVSPRGLEVDVARALARALGLRIEFRYVPHQAGLLSPGVKPWDIAFGELTTSVAAGSGRAVVPYLAAPTGVLLRRGLRLRVESAQDLRWLRLCAHTGTQVARVVGRVLKPATAPLLAPTRATELRLLAAGRCDAAVDDAARLAAAREATPDRYGGLVAALALPAQRYVAALPAHSALAPSLRAALRHLAARHELRRLSEKWLGIDPKRLPLLKRAAGTTTVTLIGDSVAASIGFSPAARGLLGQGLRFRDEAVSCRRLAAPSCGNPPPPTAMQTIGSDGRSLGQVVVMDIGYNDSASSYGGELDAAMRRMLAAGVRHVVWLTLRERYADYHSINEVIAAAARRWPEITVADWNGYSTGKPWFAADGIHLSATGAVALADFLRTFLGPIDSRD